MLFSNDRQQLRRFFFDTWQKFQARLALEPLEQQLVDILIAHPEYHAILDKPDKYLDYDYLPEIGEHNPFMHLSLHMGLLEQVMTNRPMGITPLYQQLSKKLGDTHAAEHTMIDCLAHGLWKLQRGEQYTETDYLADLKRLLR